MKDNVIFNADTVEEAVAKACEAWKIEEADLVYHVIQKPRKNLFGKVKEQALIQCEIASDKADLDLMQQEKKKAADNEKKAPLTTKLSEKEKEEGQAAEEKEIPMQPIDILLLEEPICKRLQQAEEYITLLLSSFSITKLQMEWYKKGRIFVLNMQGENVSYIIGKRGETLDALQMLTSLAINKEANPYISLLLDVGGFRQARRISLEKLANNLCKKAMRTGKKVTLEPMNAYERRIIHMALAEKKGIKSKSIGREPHRRICIFPERSENRRRKDDYQGRNKKETGERAYHIKTPVTYNFEKEFLKDSAKEQRLYAKIQLNDEENSKS